MTLKQIFLRNVKDAGRYEMSVEPSPSESIEQAGFRRTFSDLVRDGLLTVDVDGFQHTYELTAEGEVELRKLESATVEN